jgi:hypothetical protein
MTIGTAVLLVGLGFVACVVQAAIFWDQRRRDRLEENQVGEKKDPRLMYHDSWSFEEWNAWVYRRDRFKRSVRRPLKRVVKRRPKPFDK